MGLDVHAVGASTLWSVEVREPGAPVRNVFLDLFVVAPDGGPGVLNLLIPPLLIIHSWQATWLRWLLEHVLLSGNLLPAFDLCLQPPDVLEPLP